MRVGLFSPILAVVSARGSKPDRLVIVATHVKAHRAAASLHKKGLLPDVSGAPKAV
jgi:hypothetical protein